MRRLAPQARVAHLALASIALAATLTPRTSHAQVDMLASREGEDPAEHAARALFAEAMAFAETGRWAEARDRYRRSLEMKFAPETLYSLGVAQKQTGAFVEALDSFERFLDEAPDGDLAPFRRAAVRAVTELERAVGRISVRVDAPPRGLSIAIDDEPIAVDEAGGGRRVNPGHHTIQAIAPGQAPRVLTVAIAPGEHEEVRLDLGPAPPSHAGVGWTLVGVGAGLGAAGLVTAIAGLAQPDRAASEGRAMTIAGTVGASVGAFCAGLGALFLLDEPRGDDVLASVEVAPGGLGLRLDF